MDWGWQAYCAAASVYQPMKERIARSEMLVYEGARHRTCEYLPHRCVADLQSFLERHRAE